MQYEEEVCKIGDRIELASQLSKEPGDVVKVVGQLAEQFTKQHGVIKQSVDLTFNGARIATQVVVSSSGLPIPTGMVFSAIEKCAGALLRVLKLVATAVRNRCLCVDLAKRCKSTFKTVEKIVLKNLTDAGDGPVHRLTQLLEEAATMMLKYQKEWKLSSFIKASVNSKKFMKLNAELTRIRNDVMFRLHTEFIALRSEKEDEEILTARFQEAKLADEDELDLNLKANQRALSELKYLLTNLGDIEGNSIAILHRVNKQLQMYQNENMEYIWEIKREHFQLAQDNFGQNQRLGDSSSKVFIGHYRRLECAIKEFKKGEFKEPKVVKEVDLLFSIHHQNICKCIGACRSIGEGKFYILMEKLSGITLEEKIRQGRLSVQEVTQFTIGITEGLKCLHNMTPSILHRAIKPENILIDNRGNAKLINFGISKRIDEVTSSSIENGSEKWMPPEVFEDVPIKSPAMDIFSIGVIIWQMITGNQHPFARYSNSQLVELFRNSTEPINFDWPSDTSPFLKELSAMCVNRNYLLRPSAEDLVVALEGFQMNDHKGPLFDFRRIEKPASSSSNQ